jgi:hypothetical protein
MVEAVTDSLGACRLSRAEMKKSALPDALEKANITVDDWNSFIDKIEEKETKNFKIFISVFSCIPIAFSLYVIVTWHLGMGQVIDRSGIPIPSAIILFLVFGIPAFLLIVFLKKKHFKDYEQSIKEACKIMEAGAKGRGTVTKITCTVIAIPQEAIQFQFTLETSADLWGFARTAHAEDPSLVVP